MAVPICERLTNPTPERCAVIVCPDCGTSGTIDEDQFDGRVSIQCPNCAYHETHNLRQKGAGKSWSQ